MSEYSPNKAFEPLDQRRMLAADLPLDHIEVEAISESSPLAPQGESSRQILTQTESEGSATILSRNYDADGDGSVTPIDVLRVINALDTLKAVNEVTADSFTRFDVNANSVLSFEDVDAVIANLDVNPETLSAIESKSSID